MKHPRPCCIQQYRPSPCQVRYLFVASLIVSWPQVWIYEWVTPILPLASFLFFHPLTTWVTGSEPGTHRRQWLESVAPSHPMGRFLILPWDVSPGIAFHMHTCYQGCSTLTAVIYIQCVCAVYTIPRDTDNENDHVSRNMAYQDQFNGCIRRIPRK